jgi:hypothetical protein
MHTYNNRRFFQQKQVFSINLTIHTLVEAAKRLNLGKRETQETAKAGCAGLWKIFIHTIFHNNGK